MQEARFNAALAALSDPRQTTVMLVVRPERGAIAEAARTSVELVELGLGKQALIVNGLFQASDPQDPVAGAIEALGRQALVEMPTPLRELPRATVPLRAFDMVGLPALRALLSAAGDQPPVASAAVESELPAGQLEQLVDELAANDRDNTAHAFRHVVGTMDDAGLSLGQLRHDQPHR